MSGNIIIPKAKIENHLHHAIKELENARAITPTEGDKRRMSDIINKIKTTWTGINGLGVQEERP